MVHVTQILSEFVFGLQYEDLPDDVIEWTRKYILDYYAAGAAGYRINKIFNQGVEEVFLEMGGNEECDFLFSDQRIPCMNAAFLSACYVHGADMDDGNRKAMGHVGAHVISAVMSLAQSRKCDGRQIITAINVGYEVYNRVAAAVQPGLVHRGFHSTGTAGAIACGAACAKLMGMSVQQIYHTMALCAIQSSGLILIAESGQCCKPVNPANAAKTGILSAKLIEKGIESSIYPLESKKGFFHAMSDEVDEQMLLEGLGEVFTITESYMKPYPSCRHTHCGIECILELRKYIHDWRAIRKIRVYIYGNAIRIAGQIQVPSTADDTKFSIHYAIATALVRGRFGLEDLNITQIEELIPVIRKIELIEDAAMEDSRSGIRGCRVAVEMECGEEYEKTVRIPLGDAANPLTMENLREKLYDCAQGILTAEQQEILVENIWNLDKVPDISTINLYKKRLM